MFKLLSNRIGGAFTAISDFLEIRNSTGCGSGDAFGAAALTYWVGSAITKVSFAFAAGIVNPIALLALILMVVYFVDFLSSLIKSGVAYVCRSR